MTQTPPAEKKPAADKPAASEDLSKAIEQSMERQPDELVKSVRLFDDYYRCNWWVPDKAAQPVWLSMGRIRRSRFLRVTRAGSELVIEDVDKRRATRA
jgi:hypothetical protein